jgi:hypothetical protein
MQSTFIDKSVGLMLSVHHFHGLVQDDAVVFPDAQDVLCLTIAASSESFVKPHAISTDLLHATRSL